MLGKGTCEHSSRALSCTQRKIRARAGWKGARIKALKGYRRELMPSSMTWGVISEISQYRCSLALQWWAHVPEYSLETLVQGEPEIQDCDFRVERRKEEDLGEKHHIGFRCIVSRVRIRTQRAWSTSKIQLPSEEAASEHVKQLNHCVATSVSMSVSQDLLAACRAAFHPKKQLPPG